ncbi:helix-turn-helix domain-containing protein [Halomarina rubra]|uniref:Helix-turn-helix domain-containing protein n=1 Tax=Halomarina rubra TaxID=2071873 RepID=A0ABD6ATB2_9EURY|nr:helix-turn-helix domain-containing protein [Halomarina rubra]
MLELTLDMEQYDCPFIAASDGAAVSFCAAHWEFDPTDDRLETRMVVEGASPDAVDEGLRVLRDHDGLREYDLISRRGAVAHVRTAIDETAAMGTIRDHDGYITGPFRIADGRELWHVGFDRDGSANAALSALDRDNEYDVVSRDPVDITELSGFVQNVGAAMTLVEGCRDLTPRERETLEAAVDGGYFDSPRGETLGTLADRFDVSKPAVSKTLRRGQAKTMARITQALDEMDEE